MDVNKQLLLYLKDQFDETVDIVNFAKKNSFYFSIAHLLDIDIEKQFYYKTNNLRYEIYFKNLTEILYAFSKNNISAIVFKGIVLANRLYDKAQKRYVGDMDIFVNRMDFPIALTTLIKLGFVFRDNNTFYNEHHIVFIKENITIELHKNIFNPTINIDVSYLISNTESLRVGSTNIKTFSITASLLHLIYHLYMDTYMAAGNLYNAFVNKTFPKVGRFLYRAYEIALFAEKYYKEIKWEDIQDDIKHQKLRIIFKQMILDILNFFPNAFPESLINTVLHLDYTNDERDDLYNYILESKVSTEESNISYVLCNYIDEKWNTRKENNIHKNIGQSFKLIKNYTYKESNKELCCRIDTKKKYKNIELTFTVSDDDFFFSDINDYNTLASDGVHLLLCSTEDYSYNSIFLFPKNIENNIEVVPCNVLNNANIVLSKDLIKATFAKSEKGYVITVTLFNKFLKKNHMDNYFYMGLVISDCDSKTKRRAKHLILSEIDSEWYNPIYFAKIEANLAIIAK